MSRLGHNRERQVKAVLEADGWFVVRAAGSLGVLDLVALKAGYTPRLIEVKATGHRSRWSGFGPEDRAELREAARIAGAHAQLAHWPPRGKLTWVGEPEWPREGGR